MRGTRTVACAILVLLIAASAVVAQIVESAGAPSGIKDGQITSRCRNYAELEPATAVTFVVVALFGGLICYHVLSKIPLPYTALLLAYGVILGVANEAGAHWDKLAQGICLWENINPVLLLAVFLPVLLFGSAASAHWHTVRRQLPGILLLAFPGVLLGTAAIAILTKYTFPYHWTWTEALLFGSMMAATDPVATVAVLGECGASEKLKLLIEGESLVNDGSASVVFFLMQAWVEGQSQSAGKAIRISVQLSLGGAAFGVVVGILATLWLRFMFDNKLAEITLTLVAAYGAYTISDELLHVSGLLALVACGTWLAAKGRHRISSKVEPPMRTIWQLLEFLANTLVFVLAGVIIAGRIWNSAHEANSPIQPQDYGYAVLLWVYLQVVRGATVLVLWPMLSRMGYGLTWREGLVLVWAGLRGAVGLSLSLFVLLNKNIEDVRYRTLSFFFMGLMSVFTLVIQGSTTGLLLQYLGLTRPPKERRHFLEQVFKDMDKDLESIMAKAHAEDHPLGEPDWVQVKHHTQLDSDTLLQRYGSVMNASFLDLSRSQTGQTMAGLGATTPGKRRAVLTADRRRRLLLSARASLLDVHFFEKDSDVYHVLSATDKALDHTDRPLRHWEMLQSSFKFSSRECAAYRAIANIRWLAPLAQWWLAKRLQSWLLQTSAFVFIQEDAAKELYRYEALEDSVAHDEDMTLASSGGHMQKLLAQEAARTSATRAVLLESKREVDAANAFLTNVHAAFPEVAEAVRTSQLAHVILAHKNRFVEHLTYTGLVEELEASEMEDLLERRTKRLYFWGPRASLPLPQDVARADPVLKHISASGFATLMKGSCIRIVNAGELVTLNDPTAPLLLLRGFLRPLPNATANDRSTFGDKTINAAEEMGAYGNALKRHRSALVNCSGIFADGALEVDGSHLTDKTDSAKRHRGSSNDLKTGHEIKAERTEGSQAEVAASEGDGSHSPWSGTIAAPALLGAQTLLEPHNRLGAAADRDTMAHRLRFAATTIAVALQLRSGALEIALHDEPQATTAAKTAALAQQLLMHGGASIEGQQLTQLVHLIRGGVQHKLSAGNQLPTTDGPRFLVWGAVKSGMPAVNGGNVDDDTRGEIPDHVGPCILLPPGDFTAVTTALVVSLLEVTKWPPAERVPISVPRAIRKASFNSMARRWKSRSGPNRASGLRSFAHRRPPRDDE